MTETTAAASATSLGLVFTDIERSTRLLAALGDDAYERVLDAHWSLLRSAWSAHGGTGVRTEGDGGFAVFPDPASALAASVEAQLAIARHSWPRDLRVRIGVHAGAANRTSDGDYVGLAVHHAARVAQAANGGQIVVSDDVAASLKAMPEFTALADAGTFILRDVDTPVRLYLVEHPDLARDTRPLRAPSSVIHNLPIIRTAFVGRVDEMKEVSKLVLSEPLVTIIGPGGVGKTRLAIEAASGSTQGFEDGVWLVELASVVDGSTVAARVAGALELADDSTLPALDAAVEHLRHRSVLLVLDNCEHVIDEVAVVADSILRSCSEVTILATSREPLRVRGETAWRLPSLAVPDRSNDSPDRLAEVDSVRLFCDRAVDVHRDFVLDDRSSSHVAQICRRLDGIPLAIELAAARIASLGVDELDRSLDDRFATLVSGYRTDAPRQRTLRAALDWSFDLLDDRERVLFEQLSVFRGGATLDAIELTCGSEGLPVLPHLASLVDKSLVVTTDDRFTMLETIHAYAAERLADRGGIEGVRERHRDALLALFSREPGERPPGLTEKIAAEVDNTRAALAFRADAKMLRLIHDVVDVWSRRVSFDECRRWLELALDANPEPGALRANTLAQYADVAASAGLFEKARRAIGEALEWFRAAGDERNIAESLFTRAEIALTEGNAGAARPDLEESVSVASRLHNDEIVSKCSYALAHVAMQAGLLSDAVAHAEAARDSFASLELRAYEAQALMLLGEIQRGRNDAAAAREALTRAIDILGEVDDRSAGWYSSWILGQVDLGQGETEAGLARLRAAHEIADELADVNRCLALGSVAYAALLSGDAESGFDLMTRALAQAEAEGPPFALAQNRTTRGAMHVLSGDYAAALTDSAAALVQFVADDAVLDAMRALQVYALAASGLERHALAVTLLSAVLTARDAEQACIEAIDAPLIDKALSGARRSMDASDFAAAEAQGRRIDAAAALDLIKASAG